MILTPILIPAGVFAGVSLTMTILYYILSRFRPPVHFPPPPPKSTAENLKKVLRTIPVVGYSKNEGVRECSVCLSPLEEGEKVRFLPDCGHGFHVQCIDKWLFSQLSCPFCRSPVRVPAKYSDSKPDAVEFLTGLRSLLIIKMAFWLHKSSSREDDGSNGGGEPEHEREESSPV